jgi:glycosyltransferase involved in cell wall biosynthesis
MPLHLAAVPGGNARGYAAWLAKSVFLAEALRRVARSKPDAILLNGYTSLYYAPFVRRLAKVVLYAREMLEPSGMGAKLVKAIVNRYVDHVLCITENEMAQLADVQCPKSVIYNSNDHPIRGGHPRALAAQAQREVRVGVFGQIYHAKGQFFLLEAVEKHRIALEQANVAFTVYGAAATRAAKRDLERVLSSAGQPWRRMVRFAGWVSDVPLAMRDVDIVLRPDLTGSPWGRDIVEAMSNGLPVLAAGSNQVFVRPGTTGELFPPGDADAMVHHIIALARDRAKRLRYGENALAFARSNFDPRTNARKVMAVFDALMNG